MIGFLTDYGLADGFVAVCHAVIATIARAERVVDITHLVPPGDIRRGAAVLAQAAPYLPAGVLLGVVDPGVGTSRRGIALRAGGHLLVGPDNGLLLPAAEALGGPGDARELADPAWWRPIVSATFHGRDVFAPVAAHLATGVPLAALGPRLDLATLVRLPPPVRRRTPDGGLEAEVITVDRFGNVQLAAGPDDYPGRPVRTGGREVVCGTTFADVPTGVPLLFVDSAGHLALAVNGGSAAELFTLTPGDVVTITAA